MAPFFSARYFKMLPELISHTFLKSYWDLWPGTAKKKGGWGGAGVIVSVSIICHY